MPDPNDRDPDEPDTNEPIPTPADDTGIASGDEPTSPSELPSPEVDPAAERDDDAPSEPPGDLDDGPLVAMNANRPSES